MQLQHIKAAHNWNHGVFYSEQNLYELIVDGCWLAYPYKIEGLVNLVKTDTDLFMWIFFF